MMIDVLKMANAGLDRIVDERDDAIARAEAADATLASCNRARQAAEAECERLRARISAAEDVCGVRVAGAEALSTSLRAEIGDLNTYLDAAIEGKRLAEIAVERLQQELNDERAEVERLRAQVAQAKADGANEERSLHWMRENTEIAALRKQVATLRYALQFVMSATSNRLSITSMNVATSALEATYNTSQDAT